MAEGSRLGRPRHRRAQKRDGARGLRLHRSRHQSRRGKGLHCDLYERDETPSHRRVRRFPPEGIQGRPGRSRHGALQVLARLLQPAHKPQGAGCGRGRRYGREPRHPALYEASRRSHAEDRHIAYGERQSRAERRRAPRGRGAALGGIHPGLRQVHQRRQPRGDLCQQAGGDDQGVPRQDRLLASGPLRSLRREHDAGGPLGQADAGEDDRQADELLRTHQAPVQRLRKGQGLAEPEDHLDGGPLAHGHGREHQGRVREGLQRVDRRTRRLREVSQEPRRHDGRHRHRSGRHACRCARQGRAEGDGVLRSGHPRAGRALGRLP